MTTVLQYAHDNRDAVLEQAAAALREGRAIVFPSDTVYALLALADNAAAHSEIFTLKQREPGQPLALLASPAHPVVSEIVKLLEEYEEEQDAFLSGELTAVFPAGRLRGVPQSVARIQAGGIGVRLPAWEPLSELIERCGGLLWGTSANRSGQDPEIAAEGMLEALPGLGSELLLCVTLEQELPGRVSDVVRFGPAGPETIR